MGRRAEVFFSSLKFELLYSDYFFSKLLDMNRVPPNMAQRKDKGLSEEVCSLLILSNSFLICFFLGRLRTMNSGRDNGRTDLREFLPKSPKLLFI